MAGRDNVLFHASIASGATAGTVIPLSFQYGIENVRQGYGTPKLKNVRAVYDGCWTGNAYGIMIDFKNSNWIDSAGLTAQSWADYASLNRDSLAFMRGRDKVLAPNTSWIVNATLPANTTAAGDVYVIFEIEYSDVPGYPTENAAGSPVLKECKNASAAGSANAPFAVGTFDNLLQGTTYLLAEASVYVANITTACTFLILEGFSNQRGLVRIIPVKHTGLCDQIEGSVYITKQTYNLGMIRSAATSGAVDVRLEMIASNN